MLASIGWGVGLALTATVAAFPMLVRWFFRAPRRREDITPVTLGLPCRSVRIPGLRGCRLHAWVMDAAASTPVVVLLHGWGGNAQDMLPLGAVLHRAGFAVLLLDARNHGMSDSDGFSSMVKFAEDLEHALAWAREDPQLQDRPVGVLGHSVGGAAALLAASRDQGVGAVVTVGSFAHPAELMTRILAARHIRFRPLVSLILRYIERRIGHSYDTIAPVATLSRVRAPVLLVHGESDARVPVEDAETIFSRRGRTPVELWRLPGMGHSPAGALKHDSERLIRFLSRHLGDPSRAAPETGP